MGNVILNPKCNDLVEKESVAQACALVWLEDRTQRI